jgi:hypothetical protein
MDFALIFKEIGHFFQTVMLAYTRLGPKQFQGCSSIVIVAISWPHRPIRDDYRYHAEYCE